MRWNPSAVRDAVWRRDEGVCAVCGFDAKLAARIMWYAVHHVGSTDDRRLEGYDHDSKRPSLVWVVRSLFRQLWGLRSWCADPLDAWDADHITPVCEGGANTLANLRTLCIPCHKAATAALAARRAAKRKAPGGEPGDRFGNAE